MHAQLHIGRQMAEHPIGPFHSRIRVWKSGQHHLGRLENQGRKGPPFALPLLLLFIATTTTICINNRPAVIVETETHDDGMESLGSILCTPGAIRH
jgi:hypothetical protein